jgi:CheY-like chemotaxis protein
MYAGIILKRFDLKVMPAKNGMEVLKFLRISEADVLLLDINMSPMDGFTVLKHIKEDKQTSHVPVIMVSDDSSRETAEKCKNLGCFDYLTKPLKIYKLYDSLERCLFSHMGTNGRHLRADLNKKVEVRYEGENYELYAENLSEGGIFVRKEEPFLVDSEVDVKFYLGGRESIQLKGIIIYTKKLFGDFLTLPPGMAIQFKGLTEKNAKALKFYIEDLIAKDILDGQEEKVIER